MRENEVNKWYVYLLLLNYQRRIYPFVFSNHIFNNVDINNPFWIARI